MKSDQAFLLTKGNAISLLQSLRGGTEPSGELLKPYPNLVEVDGGFRGLHDSLKDLCDVVGSPRSKDARAEFEAEGCIIVHKALKNLPDDLIDDPDFWLWATIFLARDVVHWRHGPSASYGNYGIEDRFEGLLSRMFLRAHLVYSETASDPYELARRGTQDFWRSFMIRRNYASVRTMARAVARRVNFEERGVLSDSDVRIVGPKITQLNSTYSYELFDEARCLEFVDREVRRLLPDVRG